MSLFSFEVPDELKEKFEAKCNEISKETYKTLSMASQLRALMAEWIERG